MCQHLLVIYMVFIQIEVLCSCRKNHWQAIEEKFGDDLHVRGLTGIVECAENYLLDHPLVVIFWVKSAQLVA